MNLKIKGLLKMKRHWSFIVCDKRILFPLAFLFLVIGLILAICFNDPNVFNRFGNFIIAIGVWMNMRYVFREGLNKNKDARNLSPVLPKVKSYKLVQLNPTYFNNITFSIGDAKLSVQGFILVVIGSIIGSFGDIIIKPFFTGLPDAIQHSVYRSISILHYLKGGQPVLYSVILSIFVIIILCCLIIVNYKVEKEKKRNRTLQAFLAGLIRSISDYKGKSDHLNDPKELPARPTSFPISYDVLLDNITFEFSKDFYLANYEKWLKKDRKIFFDDSKYSGDGFNYIYLDFFDKRLKEWTSDLKPTK